jgi:glycosyltransferase involved in cell wall biosynthesis
VLLQIGMLGPDALSLELTREASRWGEDWTLVLHASSRFDEADPYVQRIRRAGNGRTLLSLEPLRYDDLDALVASAHVGLAFYRPALGPHFVSAQASGKLGQYLRCGLPVVCSDFPGLADTVGRYRCGVGVTSVAEVTRAVREVLENYAAYRANAVRCYEEAYEFGAHFRQVVSEIERA